MLFNSHKVNFSEGKWNINLKYVGEILICHGQTNIIYSPTGCVLRYVMDKLISYIALQAVY